MNLLTDRPPVSLTIGGRQYAIRSDFRTSIRFELLMQNEELSPEEMLDSAMKLYFPVLPTGEDISQVIQAVMWFYLCGRTDKEEKLKSLISRDDEGDDEDLNESDTYQQQAYSFDYDDEYIYAAFLQQYGINLSNAENLHWWEFRALFKALDDKCQFVKIMSYRTAKITSEMSKAEKSFLRKMKSVHALPRSKAEQEQNQALVEALKNGGDISALLGN